MGGLSDPVKFPIRFEAFLLTFGELPADYIARLHSASKQEIASQNASAAFPAAFEEAIAGRRVFDRDSGAGCSGALQFRDRPQQGATKRKKGGGGGGGGKKKKKKKKKKS